jgi:hypothetical protein
VDIFATRAANGDLLAIVGQGVSRRLLRQKNNNSPIWGDTAVSQTIPD